MNLVNDKMKELREACEEVEKSSLSNKTKILVLKKLKEELFQIDAQNRKYENDINFINKGFKK